MLAQAGKTPATDWLPEKFRVMKGENEFDFEASARKLAESYAGLEKRVGSGDVPPKSPDEYTVAVPDQFKEHFQEDERFKAFRADAHAQGITQKQFDFMMERYFKVAPELVAGAEALTVEQATAELKQGWKTESEYKTQLGHAFMAFDAFAAPADKEKIDEIGNNPVVVRLLANIGREMGEAGGIPAGATSGEGEDIQSLLRSPAYLDPKHADHKAVAAKVKAFYEKKHGTAAVA